MSSQKIRVLRIANRLNMGGPTYNVCYLSKHLGESFETMLVAEKSSGFVVCCRIHGSVSKFIPSMRRAIRLRQDRKAYQEIRKIIREYKPHVVHTHAAKAGAIGRYAAYKEGVPVVLHTYHGHVFHSYFNKAKTAVFLAIERFLGRRSSALIAISLAEKRLSKYTSGPGIKVSCCTSWLRPGPVFFKHGG